MIAETPDLVYDKSQLNGLNKYQKDGVYLIETIHQAYPRLDNKISQEVFEKEKEKLLSDLSLISNDQDFEIRLQRFVALLQDAHSSVAVDYSTPGGGYPIRLFKEKTNWIIANIDQAMDSTLIGSKVVSVNNISMSDIESMAWRLESGENIYWTNLHFSYNLYFPSYWEALGIIKSNDDKLDIVLDKNGVERIISLYPNQKAVPHDVQVNEGDYPFTRKQNNGFYYKTDKEENYAYLQMNTSLDYVSIKSEIGSYTNFFIRPFALSYLKKQKKDAMNFGITLQSLFKEIHEKGIGNLIIDLRYNNGGDERTGKQLVWYLGKDDIKPYTAYIKVSDYFKQTVKLDYKKYNNLYKAKHGKTIPNREVNLNTEVTGQNYFDDITNANSPYLLDTTIPKFKGKVYVLIGNMTFSAAMILATTIKDNGLAVFVGQPTGNQPTCQTYYSNFKLPNTKKIIKLSYVYMERPDPIQNAEKALYPHITVDSSFQDFIDGKDPGFEYILNTIK